MFLLDALPQVRLFLLLHENELTVSISKASEKAAAGTACWSFANTIDEIFRYRHVSCPWGCFLGLTPLNVSRFLSLRTFFGPFFVISVVDVAWLRADARHSQQQNYLETRCALWSRDCNQLLAFCQIAPALPAARWLRSRIVCPLCLPWARSRSGSSRELFLPVHRFFCEPQKFRARRSVASPLGGALSPQGQARCSSPQTDATLCCPDSTHVVLPRFKLTVV